METIRVYVEKVARVENGLPPMEFGKHVPGTHQDPDYSLPIEYNIEGVAYSLPVVGKSFVVLRSARNGVSADGLFETSKVTEVGETYFKTLNSVYLYRKI